MSLLYNNLILLVQIFFLNVYLWMDFFFILALCLEVMSFEQMFFGYCHMKMRKIQFKNFAVLTWIQLQLNFQASLWLHVEEHLVSSRSFEKKGCRKDMEEKKKSLFASRISKGFEQRLIWVCSIFHIAGCNNVKVKRKLIFCSLINWLNTYFLLFSELSVKLSITMLFYPVRSLLLRNTNNKLLSFWLWVLMWCHIKERSSKV